VKIELIGDSLRKKKRNVKEDKKEDDENTLQTKTS